MKRATRLIHGFIAGFLATLLFHQPMLWLLNIAGVVKRAPYSLDPTRPFGVPSAVSLAFWGGLWGIIFVLIMHAGVKGAGHWIRAAAFGAVAPTLVAWFIVAPIKNLPIAGGWKPPAMLTALLVNAAWGLGTAVFLRVFKTR